MPKSKRSLPGSVRTSEEELRHALAAGCAAVALGTDHSVYQHIIAHTEVKGLEGEYASEWPNDGHKTKAQDELEEQVAALSAFGPAAALPDVIKLIQQDKMAELVERSCMSEPDVKLAERYKGPPLLPLRVIVAVQHLERRVGTTGFYKLSKVLRDVTNQNVEPLRLADLVPFEEAEAALAAAEAELKTHLKTGPQHRHDYTSDMD